MHIVAYVGQEQLCNREIHEAHQGTQDVSLAVSAVYNAAKSTVCNADLFCATGVDLDIARLG